MWSHLAVACVGLWLMAAPGVLGFGRPAAVSAWIVGPMVASFAAVALWGATRPVRWANVPLGAWLVVAPLVVTHPREAAVNSVACGLCAIGLSLVRGRINHRFGGGWSSVWRGATAGEAGAGP